MIAGASSRNLGIACTMLDYVTHNLNAESSMIVYSDHIVIGSVCLLFHFSPRCLTFLCALFPFWTSGAISATVSFRRERDLNCSRGIWVTTRCESRDVWPTGQPRWGHFHRDGDTFRCTRWGCSFEIGVPRFAGNPETIGFKLCNLKGS